MDRFGNDFDSATGSVMTRAQLEDQRRKRGECVTCGRKCFQKKLFKTIPITDHGRVLNGRCLNCHPITAGDDQGSAIPAVSRRATTADLERFNIAQSNLPTAAAPGTPTHRGTTRAGSRPRASTRSSSYRRNASSRSLPVQNTRHSVANLNYSSANSVSSAHLVRGSDASECGSEYSSHDAYSQSSSRRSLEPSGRPGLGYSPSSQQDIGGGEEKFEALDEYVPQPQPSNGERHLQRQMSGHSMDDSQDYYARNNYSQSSLRSSDSAPMPVMDDTRQYYDSPHRVLNRGGAFAPPAHGTPGSQRRAIPRGSSRGGSSHGGSVPRAMADSSRSLGSNSAASFEDAGSSNQPYSQRGIDVYDDRHNRVEQHPQYYDGSISSQPEEASSRTDDYISEEQAAGNAGLMLLRAARSNFVEILNVMRDFPEDIEVQSAALHELSEVQLTEDDSMVLAQLGGIQVIVDSMYGFPSSLELQISGCRAVWNASGTAQNQHDFVQQVNVLDIILQDMEDFVNDASLQEQAMAALANLAALEVNLDIMVEKGIFQRVVDSMTKHNESVDVLVKGCLVIANLSSHPTDLKKAMMDMGGGGALVIAMVMHPTADELQEKALRGLRNLSANCDENKIELTNIGGIDAVIGAMQVHRDSAGVQEAGAWTLSNLASNADSNALIGDCGGIDVLIRAMWVHSDVVSVLEWCCRALFTLALDERNSQLILEVGGIAAVINAMQAHVDGSSVIQEMGCAVLCNLASDESCKVRIVEEEALDAIVLAMVLYGEDENVQVRGCQVLLRLGIPHNLKAMQASNVAELVRAASEKFPESCGEPAHLLLEGLESYISHYG